MLSKSKYLSLVVALMLSSLQLAAPRMALETQEDYLNHLYLLVKDRPLRNGELNLLPDDSLPGFANTVRCVPESEEGAADMTELTRKMQFERPTIKATENLVDVKLVINLPAGFNQDGDVTLFEISSDGDSRKQLDTVSVPSCHSTCWFQLTVGVENLRDSMEFLVEFNHGDREFVRRLNPMMVLYTYREQPVSNLVDTRRKRQQEEGVAGEEDVNTRLSTLESRNDPCTKQTVRLDYSQLRWLDEDIVLISPTRVIFDFCYGHCNPPLNVPPLHEIRESFDKRARILEVVNRLSESRLTPPPCCVPVSYVAREIIYASGELVAMTTIPSVQGCGCRA